MKCCIRSFVIFNFIGIAVTLGANGLPVKNPLGRGAALGWNACTALISAPDLSKESQFGIRVSGYTDAELQMAALELLATQDGLLNEVKELMENIARGNLEDRLRLEVGRYQPFLLDMVSTSPAIYRQRALKDALKAVDRFTPKTVDDALLPAEGVNSKTRGWGTVMAWLISGEIWGNPYTRHGISAEYSFTDVLSLAGLLWEIQDLEKRKTSLRRFVQAGRLPVITHLEAVALIGSAFTEKADRIEVANELSARIFTTVDSLTAGDILQLFGLVEVEVVTALQLGPKPVDLKTYLTIAKQVKDSPQRDQILAAFKFSILEISEILTTIRQQQQLDEYSARIILGRIKLVPDTAEKHEAYRELKSRLNEIDYARLVAMFPVEAPPVQELQPQPLIPAEVPAAPGLGPSVSAWDQLMVSVPEPLRKLAALPPRERLVAISQYLAKGGRGYDRTIEDYQSGLISWAEFAFIVTQVGDEPVATAPPHPEKPLVPLRNWIRLKTNTGREGWTASDLVAMKVSLNLGVLIQAYLSVALSSGRVDLPSEIRAPIGKEFSERVARLLSFTQQITENPGKDVEMGGIRPPARGVKQSVLIDVLRRTCEEFAGAKP